MIGVGLTVDASAGVAMPSFDAMDDELQQLDPKDVAEWFTQEAEEIQKRCVDCFQAAAASVVYRLHIVLKLCVARTAPRCRHNMKPGTCASVTGTLLLVPIGAITLAL